VFYIFFLVGEGVYRVKVGERLRRWLRRRLRRRLRRWLRRRFRGRFELFK
jgi:ABC-type uncharacterized transport system fused permease/ATPase subunit